MVPAKRPHRWKYTPNLLETNLARSAAAKWRAGSPEQQAEHQTRKDQA
jgi:hypothetical protein